MTIIYENKMQANRVIICYPTLVFPCHTIWRQRHRQRDLEYQTHLLNCCDSIMGGCGGKIIAVNAAHLRNGAGFAKIS